MIDRAGLVSFSVLLLKGLNFEEDWKLLTILMGMNDICDYCKDKVCLSPLLNAWVYISRNSSLISAECLCPFQALFSVDNFIHYMTVALEMLMNEVKKRKRCTLFLFLSFMVHLRRVYFCFRFLVWLLTLFRSCPCRLWGRCRSPPRGACSSGETLLNMNNYRCLLISSQVLQQVHIAPQESCNFLKIL